jgi:hypothetical protein
VSWICPVISITPTNKKAARKKNILIIVLIEIDDLSASFLNIFLSSKRCLRIEAEGKKTSSSKYGSLSVV